MLREQEDLMDASGGKILTSAAWIVRRRNFKISKRAAGSDFKICSEF